MTRKIFLIFSILSVTTVLFVGCIGYYLLFTTKGSTSVIRYGLSRYLDTGDVAFKKTTGSLSKRMSFYNIEVTKLKKLPKGSVARIQKLDAYFTFFDINSLRLKIQNGRLRLPDSEPVLFSGAYKNASLDINFYSREVDVRRILDLFYDKAILRKVSGSISDLNGLISGPLWGPELKGRFLLEKISRNGFSAGNCPGRLAITLKDIKEKLKIYGEIMLTEGTITGPRTDIRLGRSKVLFSGDPETPSLDFNGASTVEGVNINIALKGTIDKPDLKLMSKPPIPEERLLLMLATGKSWKGLEASLAEGKASPELMRDFMDYFVSGGSGNKLAEKFGISEISFRYDAEKKGLSAKKSVSDKAALSYGIEQSQAGEKASDVTHRVGGEYKVSGDIVVEGEREIEQNGREAKKDIPPKDKVLLKYKKAF